MRTTSGPLPSCQPSKLPDPVSPTHYPHSHKPFALLNYSSFPIMKNIPYHCSKSFTVPHSHGDRSPVCNNNRLGMDPPPPPPPRQEIPLNSFLIGKSYFADLSPKFFFKIGLGADHLTFEGGGGGVIYCWQGIFFWDRYVQDITMYDFFLPHFLSQHFFFNSLYYLDSLIIVNVEFSSFMHCS